MTVTWESTYEGLRILNLVWLGNPSHNESKVGGAILVEWKVNIAFQLYVSIWSHALFLIWTDSNKGVIEDYG